MRYKVGDIVRFKELNKYEEERVSIIVGNRRVFKVLRGNYMDWGIECVDLDHYKGNGWSINYFVLDKQAIIRNILNAI